MNRKPLIIIGLGLIVLVVTYVGFNVLFSNIAPTEAEINAATSRGDTLALIARSERAENIRNIFYVIAAGEIVLTGFLAWLKWYD